MPFRLMNDFVGTLSFQIAREHFPSHLHISGQGFRDLLQPWFNHYTKAFSFWNLTLSAISEKDKQDKFGVYKIL